MSSLNVGLFLVACLCHLRVMECVFHLLGRHNVNEIVIEESYLCVEGRLGKQHGMS